MIMCHHCMIQKALVIKYMDNAKLGEDADSSEDSETAKDIGGPETEQLSEREILNITREPRKQNFWKRWAMDS